jgi:hypothetical protein
MTKYTIKQKDVVLIIEDEIKMQKKVLEDMGFITDDYDFSIVENSQDIEEISQLNLLTKIYWRVGALTMSNELLEESKNILINNPKVKYSQMCLEDINKELERRLKNKIKEF